MLGDLLLRGASDIRRQPRKGFALLMLARQNAATKTEVQWIEGLIADAEKRISDGEREGAAGLVVKWAPHFGRQVEAAAPARKAPARAHVTLTKAGLEGTPAQR